MNDTPLPGQEEQPEETICPSCGRFVGALSRCPHCGARVNKRLSIRVFRYGALLLGIVGLLLLYLMVTHREIPIIQIGDIQPTMNFAYVRIAGTVTGDARIYKEAGRVRSMRFMLDDGTGEISVTAYHSQAQTLVDAGKVPRLGDLVEVAGSLSVSAEDNAIMRLQVPEQLNLVKAETPVSMLGDLSDTMVDTGVQVEGTIKKVMAPRAGSKAPWVVVIDDGTGEASLTFWDSIYAEIPEKVQLMEGAKVRARVNLKTYKGKLQLSLGQGSDLEFIDAGRVQKKTGQSITVKKSVNAERSGEFQRKNQSRCKPVAISDISADLKGKMVRVTGTVSEMLEPKAGSKAPYRVKLQDGDSEIVVVYWDKVAKHLQNNTPVAGGRLSVEGTVDKYKDELQIKVKSSRQIELLKTGE